MASCRRLESSRLISDHVPTAALQIHGTYVDGSLEALNSSGGYPGLYVDTPELTHGDHLLAVNVTGDGMDEQHEIPVRITDSTG